MTQLTRNNALHSFHLYIFLKYFKQFILILTMPIIHSFIQMYLLVTGQCMEALNILGIKQREENKHGFTLLNMPFKLRRQILISYKLQTMKSTIKAKYTEQHQGRNCSTHFAEDKTEVSKHLSGLGGKSNEFCEKGQGPSAFNMELLDYNPTFGFISSLQPKVRGCEGSAGM